MIQVGLSDHEHSINNLVAIITRPTCRPRRVGN